jgi:hypothetical protein
MIKDEMTAAEYNALVKSSSVNKKGRLVVDEDFLAKLKPMTTNDIVTGQHIEKEKSVKWFENASFYIDYVLPDLNTYINTERTNRYAAAKMKKDATNAVAFRCIHLFNTIDPKDQYDLEIYWTMPTNKKDSDNVFFGVKFILDGIVESKVLAGDGRKYIRHISNLIQTEKDKYSVYVTINKAL